MSIGNDSLHFTPSWFVFTFLKLHDVWPKNHFSVKRVTSPVLIVIRFPDETSISRCCRMRRKRLTISSILLKISINTSRVKTLPILTTFLNEICGTVSHMFDIRMRQKSFIWFELQFSMSKERKYLSRADEFRSINRNDGEGSSRALFRQIRNSSTEKKMFESFTQFSSFRFPLKNKYFASIISSGNLQF